MLYRLKIVILTLLLPSAACFAQADMAAGGDRFQGVEVISTLDTTVLTPGKHLFYFQAGWHNTGQPILVPVIVLKGQEAGKRLLLTAAVHGDELNGIAVIHRLLERLTADGLSGTVIAVPGVNQPGMAANNRRFVTSSGGGGMDDPNRNFPGTEDAGGSIVGRYLGTLWRDLVRHNTDIAVDLHTQTRGTAYPVFVFADFRNTQAKAAAFALGADMIKNDPGEAGTLETSLIDVGIPAVTFELGAPKLFQAEIIERAVLGLENLMRRQGMLAGDGEATLGDPVVGSTYTNIYADRGGIAVIHVDLKDRVQRGQHVATLYDPFGREIGRYTAPHDGWVLAVATDPLREAGSMLVRILQ